MSITSARSIALTFTGGVTYAQVFPAANNILANAEALVTDFTTGFNAISIPTGGSTIPTAVTFIPPATNTQTLILKGVTGDTGIPLSKTDPSSIALATTATTFGVTAGGAVLGNRFIFS